MKKFLVFLLFLLLLWISPLRWKVFPPEVDRESYTFQKLEGFRLEARVLSRRNYVSGREADLSPVDLALGWGPMADELFAREIKISQGNRWYRWRTNRSDITRQEIEHHSANMHLIPASDEALRQLLRVEKGSMVRLRGHLVHVSAADGWSWRSSLSRTDTGDGACEVVLLDSIETF